MQKIMVSLVDQQGEERLDAGPCLDADQYVRLEAAKIIAELGPPSSEHLDLAKDLAHWITSGDEGTDG